MRSRSWLRSLRHSSCFLHRRIRLRFRPNLLLGGVGVGFGVGGVGRFLGSLGLGALLTGLCLGSGGGLLFSSAPMF